MSKFIEWPHIPNLASLCRSRTEAKDEETEKSGPICYRAKIKLHGRNCAISVNQDGTVSAQTHHHKLALKDPDGHVMRGYVTELFEQPGVEPYFARLPHAAQKLTGKQWQQVLVFGEWAGKDVQKFVAISHAERFFAVFALVFVDALGQTVLWTDPLSILCVLDYCPGRPKNVHVLPWFQELAWTVDFSDANMLAELCQTLGALVADIDRRDPWAAEVFGLDGPGEGLVFYPEHCDMACFTKFAFKVKGETHMGPNQIAKKHGLAAPERPEVIDVLLVASRLEQAITDLSEQRNFAPLTKADTPNVIRWVLNDIERECRPEIDKFYQGKLKAEERKAIGAFVCREFHARLKLLNKKS
jgi:hypothetical protein